MNVNTMLKAMGFNPDDVMKQVTDIQANINNAVEEIAAQGKLLRAICAKLDISPDDVLKKD